MSPAERNDPDAELVAAARNGDVKAFEALVRRHMPRVRRQALHLLKEEADANDAAQETFVRAHRALESFRGDSLFSTWLTRIATNAALMRLRAKKRRSEQSIDDLLPTFVEDGHHTQAIGPFRQAQGPDERLAQRQSVQLALSQLPENYREVLILRCIEELDTKETAKILEISVTAVKLRLHRAHQALRTILSVELEARNDL
jgi:RNA polymerase sigma-70 factor (ECF subfamily)